MRRDGGFGVVYVGESGCTDEHAQNRENRENETGGEVQNVYRVQMRTAEKTLRETVIKLRIESGMRIFAFNPFHFPNRMLMKIESKIGYFNYELKVYERESLF